MSRHMLFPPFRDARGALTLSVILTSLVPPPAAVLDRRAPSSDGQEAQHPQHVRHRARRPRKCPNRATRARFRRRLRRRIDRLSEPPSTGFGLAGGRKRRARRGVRVEDACRRPGRLGRVAGGAGDEADASRPSSRPPPPPPRAHPPTRIAPRPPSVRRCRARRSRFGKCGSTRFFSHVDDEKKTNADVPRSSSAFLPSLPPPIYATTTNRVSPPLRTPSSPPRVSSRRRTRATRA